MTHDGTELLTGCPGNPRSFWDKLFSADFLVYAGIVVLAAVIRLIAARHAYPVPGDGAHFVQHGIELAHGNPAGLSTYWSQAMIVLAALACRFGLDPARSLQGVSVLAGMAVVIGLMRLVWVSTQRRSLTVTTGLLAAVLPVMVRYSVSGYSEMPFCALLVLAIVCLWEARKVSRLRLLSKWTLGFVLLGVSVYFKASDAILFCGLIVVEHVAFLARRKSRREVGALAMGIGIFVLAALPLMMFTQSRTGRWMPGTKISNIALGDYWRDSKAVYAIQKPWEEKERFLTEKGLFRFVIKYRTEIGQRWIRYTAEAVRLMADQMGRGPFRAGPAWFLVFLGLGLFLGRRPECETFPSALLFLCVGHVLGVALNFVHLRLIVPSFVLLLPVVGMCVMGWVETMPRTRWRNVVFGLFAVAFVLKHAQFSLEAGSEEMHAWRYPRMALAGERLRRWGDDSDVLMAHGPHTPIHFYRNNPLKTVELPYASVEEIEKYAAEWGVTLIAVSDQARPHWPVTELFRGAPAPATWELLEELKFDEDDNKGIPSERIRLYRRRDGRAVSQKSDDADVISRD